MTYYSCFDNDRSQQFVAPAVLGFFRSIELGQANTEQTGLMMGSNLQDILRLLTLWFQYGSAPDVEAALADGFGHVNIDTWLVVIPQARLVLPSTTGRVYGAGTRVSVSSASSLGAL